MATASKDSGYVDNWQTGKTVSQCNLHMLTTEDCSDVIFRVGSEKHVVRAHRYVLVSRSCVFHAMFCGPLAEKGEVTIPDIDPQIFGEFLKYIYTDSSSITAENVTGLLYTSRKYAVDALFNQCAAFLENSLSEENVCQILEQCHDYGELDLEQKALKVLTEAEKNVIKSPAFLDLCSSCLEKFLKSEELRLKETDVFEAAMSWTRHQCQKRNVPLNNINIQQILGEMRYEIRFTSMSMDYLINVVGQTDMLTDSERVRIMDKSMRSTIDISPFKFAERKRAKDIFLKRHLQRLISINEGYYVPGGQNAISFSVSKDIILVGCQLYGPYSSPQEQCLVTVKLMNAHDDSVCEPFTNTMITLQGGKQLNDLLFPSPNTLQAGVYYTLLVDVPNVDTECGKGGLDSKEMDGVTFTFKRSPHSKRGTDVAVGQIPGLIFRQI